MYCLTKQEAFQSYRALLEVERSVDRHDFCFHEGENKALVWFCYFIILSPTLQVIYSLLF